LGADINVPQKINKVDEVLSYNKKWLNLLNI